ncbi:MAG: YkgJ family cysteine cluster protein [Desulfobacterales bacterium]
MNIDIAIEPFFTQYEALSKAADAIFEKVKQEFPECVKCRIQCTDCCYALFDLSLIEAMYINYRFNEAFEEQVKADVIEKANRADRIIHKIKRQAHKDFENGKKESDILAEVAKEKVRCPLLNSRNRCDLYASRPITCRLYGIPTEIGGLGRTCGQSGFHPGRPYPTVHLDMIHQKMYELSERFCASIKTRYAGLPELLVPLSMALLTNYNEEYLGIQTPEMDEDERASNYGQTLGRR